MLAVLRQIADTMRHRIPGRFDRYLGAVHQDLSGIKTVGAENRARHFGTPGTHQTGKAQDFTFAQGKTHILDSCAPFQPFDLQYNVVARGIGNFRSTVVELATHHHADDRLHGGGGSRNGRDVLAVAHDRDAIRDLPQLIHLVRDVNNADAMRLQLADDAEQILDFSVIQRRRGLIHDEYARIE